jgi:hypothetical protein
MKTQITLSQEEVQEIIKNHLEEKFKVVGPVKIWLGKQVDGDGYNESHYTVFKGATCEVEL